MRSSDRSHHRQATIQLRRRQGQRLPPEAEPELDERRLRRCEVHERARQARDHVGAGDDREAIRRREQPFQTVLGGDDRVPLPSEVEAGVDDQVGTGRVELRGRLVENEAGWPQHQCGSDGDPLPLAARERRQAAAAEPERADPIQRLLDAAGHRPGLHAEVLEPEGDLAVDEIEHGLRLQVLEDEPDLVGQPPGRRAQHVEAADHGAAADATSVQMRHEPVAEPQERRLAAARGAGDDRQPGPERNRRAAQRRDGGARVRIGQLVDRDRRHRQRGRSRSTAGSTSSGGGPGSESVG